MLPTGLDLALLAALCGLAAILYSSGGHAGASAYLALMTLWGVAPDVMKPTALALNIAVATIGSVRFARARAVPWPVVGPLVLTSVPAAALGGALRLGPRTYVVVLGAALLAAAVFLWMPPRQGPLRAAPRPLALLPIGAALGFLAGLTGVGGGVFLSPLLILAGWQDPRGASGAAVVFILCNSIAGLLGHLSSAAAIPTGIVALAPIVIAGGLFGSYLGVSRLSPLGLRRIHATLLVISGTKLLLEGLLH